MRLVRRVDPFDGEESDRRLLDIVQDGLNRGFIEGLGRGNLHTYFRSQYHNVSRYLHMRNNS